MASAGKGSDHPPPARRCSITPAVAVALVAMAVVVLRHHDRRPASYTDYLGDLQARSTSNATAAMQLGRWYTLLALNATTGPAPPANGTDAQLAAAYIRLAARLAPDACEPALAQAKLLFALGVDDDAAEHLHRVRASSACAAQADLYLAYIDEFAGFRDRAKAGFYAARDLALDGVVDAFYDRQYDYTSPVLDADQYGQRLRKLVVFRDLIEQFQQDAPGSGRDALLRPIPSPAPFGSEVDIRAGAANLDAARRTLDELDFVVLRSFLTPWEVSQIQGFYADLIRDGIVTNFDPFLSRTTTYNDRISYWLGQRLTSMVNRIALEPVKHVYSFLCWHRVVDNGNRPVLKPHTDREDNDWTVSIQMHYDDDGRMGSWPIWVHTPRRAVERAGWQELPPRSESVAIVLRDGDAVMFRGRRHIHWRDPMPESGQSYSSLLLHYVPNDFDWFEFKTVRQRDDPAI